MALFQSNTDKAASEIQKLTAARRQIAQDDERDRRRLAELRTQLPAAEVDELVAGRPEVKAGEVGTPADRLRWEITGLETTLALRPATLRTLMGRIRAAVQAAAHVRAEVLRKEAAKLERQYEAHCARTAGLLGELEQHEGVPFAPKAMLPAFGPPEAAMLALNMGNFNTKSAGLLREIQSIKQQADAIESAAAESIQGGQVAGDSLEQLLAAVADRPLAPLPATVTAWHELETARLEQAWHARYGNTEARLVPLKLGVRCTLYWNECGEIEPRSTAVRQEVTAIHVEAATRRHWEAVHRASRAAS